MKNLNQTIEEQITELAAHGAADKLLKIGNNPDHAEYVMREAPKHNLTFIIKNIAEKATNQTQDLKYLRLAIELLSEVKKDADDYAWKIAEWAKQYPALVPDASKAIIKLDPQHYSRGSLIGRCYCHAPDLYPEAIDVLVSSFNTTDYNDSIIEWIKTFGSGYSSVIEKCGAYLEESVIVNDVIAQETRRAAITALVNIQDKAAFNALLRLFRKTDVDAEFAISEMAKVNTDDSIGCIGELLVRHNSLIHFAIPLLIASKNAEAVNVLKDIIDVDGYGISGVQALTQMQTPEAIETLIEVAKEDLLYSDMIFTGLMEMKNLDADLVDDAIYQVASYIGRPNILLKVVQSVTKEQAASLSDTFGKVAERIPSRIDGEKLSALFKLTTSRADAIAKEQRLSNRAEAQFPEAFPEVN